MTAPIELFQQPGLVRRESVPVAPAQHYHSGGATSVGGRRWTGCTRSRSPVPPTALESWTQPSTSAPDLTR